MTKKNVLFLCTGNSCRSQMAHGFASALKGEQFQFFSAGIKKHGLNQRAVSVMKELGVDISFYESTLIDELPDIKFDFVITVCSHAKDNCPYFFANKVIHIGFDDPPMLTSEMKNEDDILEIYRRVRDEIKEMVLNLDEILGVKNE